MNNNQISNPKKKVSTGLMLNEKDYVDSLLSCLKNMSKDYVVAMNEASNEALYQKCFLAFNTIITLQREVYEVMFRNGWYAVEKADATKINQKHQMLSTEYKDLNL